MGLAIGIDLGTTNSCVAVVRDGKARVVQDREGTALQPSVVSFHPDGRVLVGREARERRVIDPRNTFFSVKRLIGRDFSDPDVRRVAERYPYTLVEGPNGIPLAQARGKEYTLPELCSIILAFLREVVEGGYNEPVDGVVITVPANFNDVQRSSTRVAGRIADLEVLRILNEPTAAALAYGYGQGLSERIAVYDFGGGTFDITILDLRENVFEVLATAGDMFLGGDDFDARLVDQMVAAFMQLHHVDLRENPIAMQRLRSVGEQIKCQLSNRTQVSARIRELEYGPGGKPLDMNFAVTRDGFEQRVADLVDRTFSVCDEAFRLAEMSPAQLDNVILVGGTTRIPMVRQRVTEYFNREPRADINPDEVVAIGAAIQAFALVGQQPSRPSHAPTTAPRPPGGLGRPIAGGAATGVGPEPFDDSGTGVTSATATEPFAPVPEERSTKTGMSKPRSFGAGVGSGAAAAFGGDVPDDLPRARSADTSTFASPTPQRPPPQARSGAAAAFGGDLPDDLPAPRSEETGATTDLLAPRRPGPPSAPPPAPRRPPAAAAAFGGDLPDDLPSPRYDDTGLGIDLPTPHGYEPEAGLRSPHGAGSGLGSGAAAAFGGDLPDDLPSPRSGTGLTGPGGGGADLFGDSFSWGGTGETSPSDDGVTEHSVVGTFTEQMMAPAVIGRPPPTPAGSAPGGAYSPSVGVPGDVRVGGPPSLEASFSRPATSEPELLFDEGRSWDVLSMPGAGHPQVAQVPEPEYVDSAVFIPETRSVASATGAAGIQAPGVAPLPAGLLQQLGINHVLIDVTPRTLAIQTVEGYCDPIIERNSPIPIEQSRVFTTSRDNQTAVVIRICQGESRRIEENLVLGEVALANLRPAPRGDVRVEVNFEIDTDGIVEVAARDVDTGQQAQTKVTVFGGLGEDEVRDMLARYGRR